MGNRGKQGMVVAFLLGLLGSLGHCTGMCGAIVLLLGRRGGIAGGRLLLAHLGRITSYVLLGLAVGLLGHSARRLLPHLPWLQGALALIAAGTALYLAAALLGRAPSPETYLAGLTSRWGRAMQRLVRQPTGRQPLALLFPFGIGLLWGLLPCGLVLTALLAAVTSGPLWLSALAMLAFGLGTTPALLGMGWLAQRPLPRLPTGRAWPRHAAALLVLLFGTQMALRGLAAWGWVDHLRLGGVMLW